MRRSVTVSLIVLAAAVALSADQALSRAEATRFQTKLAQIERNAVTPPRRGAAARITPISDAELNSYLKFLAGSQVPVGIAEPILHAAGSGRVTGYALVDLDAVRTQKKRAWSDPLAYLSGRLPISA